MRTSGKGFTLIELLITIAIVGILASIAIPYYVEQHVKARLTEVTNAMANVESAVSTYYMDNDGVFPSCATNAAIQNTLGIGLGSITRISTISVTNGVIAVSIQSIHPKVNGESLTLTPTPSAVDSSIRWTWGYSPTFPVHLRPIAN